MIMTAAEIIILIAGAILVTVSFFVPDKGNDILDGADLVVDDETIKSIVDEEVRKAKENIDEAAKLSVSDSKDKLERYMDRLTNEKMMAVNEYSDTVIQQIKKDHEEAVFLYDMIDNKHSQVKNTAAELSQLEKDVKRLSEDVRKNEQKNEFSSSALREAVASSQSTVTETSAPEPVYEEVKIAENIVRAAEPEPEVPATEETFTELTPQTVEVPDADKPVTHKNKPGRKSKPAKEVTEVQDGPLGSEGVELMFDSGSNSMNNNDRILALHKEGKSNMAIAKELGLGVGEVKLVIDLFKS